jgi:hypothetical protein
MQNITKRLIYWAIGIALLLSIPLIMTHLGNGIEGGNGWHWTGFDFVFMGALLFGAVLAYEFVARKMQNLNYRAAVGIAVLTGVLLVWVNGAVGIIGDENPANVLYLGVLVVGIIGSLLARFKPREMITALSATAIAQILVPLIGLFAWSPANYSWEPGVGKVFMLNGFFVLMFVISALLFRNAADEQN